MSIPGSASPLFLTSAAAAEPGVFQIDRSLRFNSADSAYLNRTPSSAGNRKTWTWSGWVKLNNTNNAYLFQARSGAGTSSAVTFHIRDSYIRILFRESSSTYAIFDTNALLRDFSAWYHLMVVLDTTQATNTNRLKIYINGIEATAASVTYPAQNYQSVVNTTISHHTGFQYPNSGSNVYSDFYLAEVYFIDGQALAPTDFGEYDDNNNWNPKDASGLTFGTNGFHLDFSDNTSNAALGIDSSDNGDALPAVDFDGSGDYLQLDAGSDFAYGTGDFTVEAYIYSDASGERIIYSQTVSGTNYFLFYKDSSSQKLGFIATLSGGGTSLLSTSTLTSNTWIHVAVTRESGTVRLFIDGSLEASTTNTVDLSNTTYKPTIGAFSHTTVNSWSGYISNLRVIKGTALYTASFTKPAAPLSNVTNTKLLCCQSGSSATTATVAPGAIAAYGDASATVFGNTIWTVNNLVATAGNTISASSVSLTAPSGGFLSGRDSKTYVIDGDTSSYLLANNSGDNYSVNFSPGITVNSSVEIYGLTSGQSASTNLSSATSYTAGQYSTIYSGSGTLTQITMVASGNRPGLAAIKVDGVLLIGTNDESGIDSLIDTPTNYTADSGNNGGNYATLNSASVVGNDSNKLRNGNLSFSGTSSGRTSYISTIASDKFYYEAVFDASGNGSLIGVLGTTQTQGDRPGQEDDGYAWRATAGSFFIDGVNQGSYGSYSANGNNIIGVAVDSTAGTLEFFVNGTSQGTATSSLPAGKYFAMVADGGNTSTITDCTVNFGQRPFGYTPPTGFKSLCSTNLPDPTIADGSTAFDAALYTGDGSSGQDITGLNFSPDFVWIKERNSTSAPAMVDIVRGTGKRIRSDGTFAESSGNSVTSFNSDGFTVGSDTATNENNKTYVGWTWDGGTSTVSNTDGSITSSVRANASAGFSIVSYGGNSTSNATVGHGLNAAPEFLIIKNRDKSLDWAIWHSALTDSQVLRFDTRAAASPGTAYFEPQNNTSSVFSLGTNDETNLTGDDYVAYCFAPVEGHSAFGSYTGNGNADGPFVYTGFRPAFILIKGSSFVSNWFIQDYARNGYNVNDGVALRPNLTSVEDGTTTYNLDILSNGFKLRTSAADANTNNATFVWAAFASHPFKTARAR